MTRCSLALALAVCGLACEGTHPTTDAGTGAEHVELRRSTHTLDRSILTCSLRSQNSDSWIVTPCQSPGLTMTVDWEWLSGMPMDAEWASRRGGPGGAFLDGWLMSLGGCGD